MKKYILSNQDIKITTYEIEGEYGYDTTIDVNYWLNGYLIDCVNYNKPIKCTKKIFATFKKKRLIWWKNQIKKCIKYINKYGEKKASKKYSIIWELKETKDWELKKAIMQKIEKQAWEWIIKTIKYKNKEFHFFVWGEFGGVQAITISKTNEMSDWIALRYPQKTKVTKPEIFKLAYKYIKSNT